MGRILSVGMNFRNGSGERESGVGLLMQSSWAFNRGYSYDGLMRIDCQVSSPVNEPAMWRNWWLK